MIDASSWWIGLDWKRVRPFAVRAPQSCRLNSPAAVNNLRCSMKKNEQTGGKMWRHSTIKTSSDHLSENHLALHVFLRTRRSKDSPSE
jgi:hypothetical protein